MAARRPPVKNREFDYSNVGKAGRRTGITLKEGKRDEHGMEELEGMFSSPEKSPSKVNGFAIDGIINSGDMEMAGSSSIPDPSDVLSARRGGRNAYLPPPRSRSPIKTLMSGSPRRTPGLRSSPLPQSEFSSPTSARVAAKRIINITHPLPQASRSPLGQTRISHYEVDDEEEEVEEEEGDEEEREEEEEEQEEEEQEEEEGEEHETVETAIQERFREEEDSDVNPEVADDEAADFSDDGNYLLDDEAEDDGFAEAPGDYHEGAENQNGDGDSQVDEEEQADVPPSPILKPSSKVKKRKGMDKVAEEVYNEKETDINPPAAKRRGRKPKSKQENDGRGDDNDNPRPTKIAKKNDKKNNIQMTTEQERDLNNVVENITKDDGPLNKKRSLYILRRETPSDSTVRHTRSGRVSVRPLAYWRNEKCVYGTGDAEIGQRFPLSTIKEIIRTEDPELDQAGRKRGPKKKSKSRNKRKGDELDDETDEHVEPWETQEGVFYGPVKIWDPENQTSTQEEEMMDVAYAPLAIETHEVKDSTFRFAKILSTPFLGSGFVEMPPNAVKKQKNSKRMHMVFFVYYGRIHVDIAGLQFSAGKGCVFQVPRGNNYSFSNDFDKPAALFFTQGCIPLDADGNVDTGVTAPPVQESPPTEPKAGGAQKAVKKRGRPKQGTQAG